MVRQWQNRYFYLKIVKPFEKYVPKIFKANSDSEIK